jgi:phosphate transport system substrate-binding protein
VITHKGIDAQNVTAGQLAAIYDGRLSAWPDGHPIRPILRPLEDVDTKIARGIAADVDRALGAAHHRGDLPIGLTDQEALDLVQKTPGGIGTIGLAMPLSEPGAVNVAKLDGVEPTLKNLSAGRYRVFKDLFIVTKKDVPPAVRDFLRFVGSEKGRAVAAKAGLLAAGAKR